MIGLNFNGQSLLVTGAGAGIGRAIAHEAAALGAYIIAVDLDPKGLAQTMQGLQGQALEMDLCDETQLPLLRQALQQAPYPLRTLVNNLGANFKSPTLDLPLELWNRSLHLNLTLAMQLSQMVLPLMLAHEKGGSIVNISSTRAQIAGPDILSYVTTKTGLIGLSRQMAYDFGPLGIRVNTICPGLILTDRIKARGASLPNLQESRALGRRYGTPEEVARVVAFVASDAASYMQNAVINVDGGQHFDGA